MDITNDSDTLKRCHKCDQRVLNNLNIFYSASNSTVVLWNKFQIFIYEDLDFENAAKVIIPDFQIRRLLLSNNHLVSLDCTGNIHVNSLKFKNTSQKRFKTCFQPKEQAVIGFTQYDQDHILSVKQESGIYFFFLHRISTEYPLVKKKSIIFTEESLVPKSIDTLILNIHALSEVTIKHLENIFNVPENVRNDHFIVIMSFGIYIYGCVTTFKDSEDEINLTKLYTCPSEISSIDIDGINLAITVSLTVGTLIKLSLKDFTNNPLIEHLNTAIHKILFLENSIVYSDGMSTWKAENLFSENVIFRKLFVNQVKDIISVGDQIICTTFTDLIYMFHIDDDKSYYNVKSEEYTSADRVLNSMDCYNKIMEAVKENNELIKKLNKDGDYITALSLTNRQDIMDTVITTKAVVYDKYEDVTRENFQVTLTEEMVNYFCNDSSFILITIDPASENKLTEILSNLLGDVKIHIVLSADKEVVKTTSVRVLSKLKKTSLLIPIMSKGFVEITADIKIITDIPGVYDMRESTWAVLYRQKITLKSQHFIETNFNSNQIVNLKASQKSLEELLVDFYTRQYGDIIEFNRHINNDIDWSFYVKLPDDYVDLLKSKTSYDQQFNDKKVQYLVEQFSSDNFYKSNSSIFFTIGNKTVKVAIEDDGFSNPLLKVTSKNCKVAINIRNFFANLLHKDSTNMGTGTEFISSSFYTSVEYLQKEVKDCMLSSPQTEELLRLIEQFERRIIGVLPI